MDNPAHVDQRMVGATPPNVYDLKPREKLFHGVAALRMTPVGENEMHGRTGLLVHSYLLGPNGDFNGCVSIKDYDRFLAAYRTARSSASSWCRACTKASLRRGVHPPRHDAVAGDAADSDTPLRAVFKINLNGKTVSIGTVGQAYRFITNLSSIEWIEFRALHADAVSALQGAADNAMLTVQATNALRALFVRAKLFVKAPTGRLEKGNVRMPGSQIEDDRLIRELLQNWAIWRDAGDWERFRTVWHPDGRMMATWTQGTGDEFIEISKQAWAKGVSILHFLGGISVDLAGHRAISQTKMTISQRAEVEGVLCDVLCTGRFYDFLEKREGRWGIVLRQPIYEKDRMDPVTPGAAPVLDKALLEQFPPGYRHLAYLQTRIGYTVKRDMPGLKGPEVEALYARGAAWLQGKPLS